tara:strand:- start:383 stop:736 length:354 start_codon:yes stop_codon:yes gene_type:complete
MEEVLSEEEDYNENESEHKINSDITLEDTNYFYDNYKTFQKKYITQPYLTKYEKTKIISERAQQIANGGTPLLKNPEVYNSVYEIAIEELKQKKIPFIIKRPVSNGFEYWKIEDFID